MACFCTIYICECQNSVKSFRLETSLRCFDLLYLPLLDMFNKRTLIFTVILEIWCLYKPHVNILYINLLSIIKQINKTGVHRG